MIGRDLIIYILKNRLESNDLEYIASQIFISEEEAASKFNVGVETIRAWYSLNLLNGITIGNSIFLFADEAKPITK